MHQIQESLVAFSLTTFYWHFSLTRGVIVSDSDSGHV